MQKLKNAGDYIKLPETIDGYNVKDTVLTAAKLVAEASFDAISKTQTVINLANALSDKIEYDHKTLNQHRENHGPFP